MNKKVFTLLTVMAILVMIRCVFDASDNLNYIVASINIVALVYVVFTVLDNIVIKICERISKVNLSKQIRKREIKCVRNKVWIMGTGICGIIFSVYLIFFCSNLGNDIISIVALTISVLDKEFVALISNNYKI